MDFLPFAWLAGSDAKLPVKILRDTGAFHSFIVNSVLPFCERTVTGDYFLVQEVELSVLPPPVHKLQMDCGLIKGEVAMAYCQYTCYTRE